MYTGGFLFVIGYSVISYSNSLVVIVAAMLLATIGELLHIPTRQAYLSQIVKDGARSSYMAVNGLFFQCARLTGTIGISVGAILPTMGMSILLLAIGLSGLLLLRHVQQQDQQIGIRYSQANAKGAAD